MKRFLPILKAWRENMTHKRFLLVAVMMMTGGAAEQAAGFDSAYRWNYGISAGYVNNSLYQGGVSYPQTENIAGHAFFVSIPARYRFLDWFAGQAELSYIQKGYGYVRTVPNYPRYNDQTINHFLNCAFLAHVSWPRSDQGLKIYGVGGGFLGFWLAKQERGATPSSTVKLPGSADIYHYNYFEDFNDRDNRFEYGLAAGFGVQYHLARFDVYLESRYHHSFSDLQTNYYEERFVPQKNETWTIHVGVMFNEEVFRVFH
ncbi:MAG: PorT family protein [Spirochaetaceae bacterium]|jgi:hypothetical protein|nr:PorT family protein [Spirochaetaceae bacterium]